MHFIIFISLHVINLLIQSQIVLMIALDQIAVLMLFW